MRFVLNRIRTKDIPIGYCNRFRIYRYTTYYLWSEQQVKMRHEEPDIQRKTCHRGKAIQACHLITGITGNGIAPSTFALRLLFSILSKNLRLISEWSCTLYLLQCFRSMPPVLKWWYCETSKWNSPAVTAAKFHPTRPTSIRKPTGGNSSSFFNRSVFFPLPPSLSECGITTPHHVLAKERRIRKRVALWRGYLQEIRQLISAVSCSARLNPILSTRARRIQTLIHMVSRAIRTKFSCFSRLALEKA
ncbi:unnamed protein product [Nesidiocoris tenuis]|uniref:Uncharacterized protein n=1 Tax=Nesidiocoris tenuis TaxID=355587 RepID=A0A6H5GEW3_9HEMI|nr:unnamed protein product [Nesidiocoris tenuis]